MAPILLKGSERQAMPGAKSLAPANPDERLEVSVLIRRRAHQDFAARVSALSTNRAPQAFLSREEFASRHGADPADLAAVGQFAAAQGLKVVEESAPQRTVVLAGTVAQFNAAFGVSLTMMEHGSCCYRGRTGAIAIPQELDGIVEAVLGLDSRPQAMPHFRIRRSVGNVKWRAGSEAATSYSPLQVAALYGFPAATGAGQCVGIIELGGGYRPADLQTYFSGLGGRQSDRRFRVGGSGSKYAHGRCQWSGRRSDAGYRSGGRYRAASQDRGVLRTEYRCRIFGCDHDGGARHHE